MLDSLVKWLLRALAVVFGASGLVGAISALFAREGAAGLGTAIIPGAVAWGLWHWSGKSDRATTHRHSVVDDVVHYIDMVNSVGMFPEAGTRRIISRGDHPVLASCEGRLLEVTTEQARQYLGTRVKVGGLPIYVGQSASRSRTVLKETAQGELALTAKALIFSGPQRSVDIDLDKIVALDVAMDGVTVSVSGRTKPFIFIVPNGILWGMLLKNLTQMKVEGRSLPAGAQLQML